jgi:hypothetical protein
MQKRHLLGALAVAAVGVLAATPVASARQARQLTDAPTDAQWASGNVQCAITVTGQLPTGQFTTEPMTCWLAPEGVTVVPKASSTTDSSDRVSPMNGSTPPGIIGTHFDGFNFTGSYISVSGWTCSGGWLNLSSGWINRISSTNSPCWVAHFDGYDLTGDVEYATFANLGALNNRANSLQYV